MISVGILLHTKIGFWVLFGSVDPNGHNPKIQPNCSYTSHMDTNLSQKITSSILLMVQKSCTTWDVPNHGFRLRFLENKCCHRSLAELSAAEQLIEDAPDVLAEIAPDDLPGWEVGGGAAEASRDLAQELWPQTAPGR